MGGVEVRGFYPLASSPVRLAYRPTGPVYLLMSRRGPFSRYAFVTALLATTTGSAQNREEAFP